MHNSDSSSSDQAAGLRFITDSPEIKVIAVTAGKGGVGKSNVTVNMALALAQKGKRVLILDGDLGLANIDVMLGLYSKHNLSHVIDGQCSLSEIILDGPCGIKIIPASSGLDKLAQLSTREHAGIVDAFSELSGEYDYLLVDTAAGISDSVLSFVRSSQEIIVVVCDEPTSLTDAYALIKVMNKRYGNERFHVLANMVRHEKNGRSLFAQLERVTGKFLDVQLRYMGAVPFDEMIHRAMKLQQAVLSAYPNTAASKQFTQLAEQLDKWPCRAYVPGNTGFFIERLVDGVAYS